MERLVLTLLALPLLSPCIWAQCELTRLEDPVGQTGDWFGFSTATDGTTLVVGAPEHDQSSGRAFVYRREGAEWVLETELEAFPSYGGPETQFGRSVAVDGDHILVGGPYAGGDRGTYSFFHREFTGSQFEWVWKASGLSTTGAEQGYSVALAGDLGAYGAPGGGPLSQGEVRVRAWDGTTWHVVENLVGGQPGDRFGEAVALTPNQLLVGAPEAGASGRVHAFGSSGGANPTFTLYDSFEPDDAPIGSHFGGAIRMTFNVLGAIAYVGASCYDLPGLDQAGAVYRFFEQPQTFPNRPVWLEGERFLADQPQQSAYFGYSLDVIEPPFGLARLCVSAPGAQGINGQFGAVHRFERPLFSSWGELEPLTAADSNVSFGFGIALLGSELYVGNLSQDTAAAPDAGAVHVFQLDPNLCPSGCAAPRLPAESLAFEDGFGQSVALLGDTALVGVPEDDTRGIDAGAVHVYGRQADCWYRRNTIYASDAAAGDRFGSLVRLRDDGQVAVVSAPWKNGAEVDQGGAYILRRNASAWHEERVIEAYPPRAAGLFGSSAAFGPGHLAIGEPGTQSMYGLVHVFEETNGPGWQIDGVLQVDNSGDPNDFGRSVAFGGDLLLVGDPLDDTFGTNQGRVSAFYELTVWQSFGFLDGFQQASGERFGSALSYNGTGLLYVGASHVHVGAELEAGVVYRYLLGIGGFVYDGLIQAAQPLAGARFGQVLDSEGEFLVVGAPQEGGRGRTHVFRQFTDPTSSVLAPADANRGAEYGSAVAISGGRVLSAAPKNDGASPESGGAWIHALSEFLPNALSTSRLSPGSVP